MSYCTSIFLQVYTIQAVKMLTDLQFEKMEVAIGHVASLRAALSCDDASKEGIQSKEGKLMI